MDQPEQNPQVVFSWSAPLRPYKKRSSSILRFYLAVAILIGSIVFFFGDRILLVPIGSLLFLFYVLTITPPPDVENKITKFGIDAAGVTFRWESLSEFYYKRRLGFTVLTIVGKAPYYYHVYMVVPSDEVKKMTKSILSEHLIYRDKPQQTLTDKLIDALSTLVPDEVENQVVEPTLGATPLSPQTTAPTI